MSIVDVLHERFPHLKGGLKRGQTNIIVSSPHLPMHNSTFRSLLRSKHLEAIGRQISADPRIHKRIAEDAIKMNLKNYEFLVGSPELYPYYVHNIFRDLFGVEKIYDYDTPPVTRIIVPDLKTVSACIKNFEFIMADQKVKMSYQVKRTISNYSGLTQCTVELILLE